MVMSNITIKGIDPDLANLGEYQRIIFGDTDPAVKFQACSQFVPTVPNDSVINIESRNVNLSGYRWKHTTKTTDSEDHGQWKFQYFTNDDVGTDLLGYDQSAFLAYVPLVSSSVIYGRRPSGMLYFNGSTTNTALTLNTWTKVAGTTTAGSENNPNITTSGSNRLIYSTTYPGGLSSTFEISASVTFQNRDSSNALLSFGFYKNGSTLLVPQCRENIIASSTNSLNATFKTQATLASTDYIELWCMSSATLSTGIRVTDGSLSMVAI